MLCSKTSFFILVCYPGTWIRIFQDYYSLSDEIADNYLIERIYVLSYNVVGGVSTN